MSLYNLVREAVTRVFKGETIDDNDDDVKKIKRLVARGSSIRKSLKEVDDAITEHSPGKELRAQLDKITALLKSNQGGSSRKTKRRHNRRSHRTQKYY